MITKLFRLSLLTEVLLGGEMMSEMSKTQKVVKNL